MSGEQNLASLLQSMRPELKGGIFVFCTTTSDVKPHKDLDPVLLFHEDEGLTFVVLREEAERIGQPYEFPSRMITLTVHSALNAVGFMAAITTCLGQAGISVNPVSAFYHDHLFVPLDRADDAMVLLKSLSGNAGSGPSLGGDSK